MPAADIMADASAQGLDWQMVRDMLLRHGGVGVHGSLASQAQWGSRANPEAGPSTQAGPAPPLMLAAPAGTLPPIQKWTKKMLAAWCDSRGIVNYNKIERGGVDEFRKFVQSRMVRDAAHLTHIRDNARDPHGDMRAFWEPYWDDEASSSAGTSSAGDSRGGVSDRYSSASSFFDDTDLQPKDEQALTDLRRYVLHAPRFKDDDALRMRLDLDDLKTGLRAHFPDVSRDRGFKVWDIQNMERRLKVPVNERMQLTPEDEESLLMMFVTKGGKRRR